MKTTQRPRSRTQIIFWPCVRAYNTSFGSLCTAHNTPDAKIILSISYRSIKHVSFVFRLHYPIGQQMLWRGNRCPLGLTMTTSQLLTASESRALPGEVKKLNSIRK